MTIKEKILAPSENPNDETILLGTVHKNHLSQVKAGDIICEIETSKAIVDISCQESGYIEWLFEEGEEITVGLCFANIHDHMPSNSKSKEKNKNSQAKSSQNIQFTKKAQKLFDESNLSLDNFKGYNFVTEKDILKQLSPQKENTTHSKQTSAIPLNTRNEKLSFQKRQEIKALDAGQNLLTSNFAVKVRLPKEFFNTKKSNSFNNLKNHLTPTILIKTCALLNDYPEFNAFYNNGSIHYYEQREIGYALDLGQGLKVVNLGDISEKTPEEVNKIMYSFFINYSRGKLSVKDLTGSTFSVTDVSAENVLQFSPLINCFQSAILGISTPDEQEAAFILNLVFDHRVTEGKKAANFLNELKKHIETSLLNE